MLRAGKLSQLLTLEEPVETRDAQTGEVRWSWRFWAEVRASLEPLSLFKQYQAAEISGNATAQIRMRYRPGVTAKMRFIRVREYASSPQLVDVYEITGAPQDRDGRREELVIPVRLRDAEGFRSDGTD